MYDHEHPMRQNSRKFYGERLDAELDRWFIRQDPHTRQAYINNLGNIVAQDDGVSLRKKSMLMRDTQRLAQMDRELRLVKR